MGGFQTGHRARGVDRDRPRTGVFTGSIASKFADAVVGFVIQNNGNLDVRGRDFDRRSSRSRRPRAAGARALNPVEPGYVSPNGLMLAADLTLQVHIDGAALFTRDGRARRRAASSSAPASRCSCGSSTTT